MLGRVGRQGQVAAELQHTVVVDQDGTVVAGRMGIEYALQKGLAEEAVEVGPPGEVAVQGIVSLDDNQGADFLAGKISGSLGDDLRAFLEGGLGKEFPPKPAQHRQSLEEAAQILLKDDHQDEQQDREEGLKNDGRQVELEEPGQKINDTQERDAEKDEPQPQVVVAFGFLITNCEPSRPSV